MTDPADTHFGQLAVREGLASVEQVEQCLAELERLREQGKPAHLGALLVHRGILDREQVRSLLERQNKQVLRCPQCARTYTVFGLPAGKTMPCKECRTPLRREGADVLTRSEPAESPGPSEVLDALTQLAPGGTTRITAVPGNADPLIGAVLSGKYEILEKIGQGGMGAVYRARHTQLDRLCAVKILPRELAADAGLTARLKQEAKACARLDQKNVVQIYDVDSDQGYEYLAMEFIDGQDLESLVKARRRLPVDQALSIARQAALGLAAAHAKGIIHRDVKPANLMLTRQGVVKVTDFGLSRLIEGASHLSHTGQILGTPHYMSPEQAKGQPVDHRTDIYSLGATLYLMHTGQTPFLSTSPTALLLKAISEEPPSPREINRNVPLDLSAVIGKMMAKERDERYPDMASLLADLERVERGQRPEAGLAPVSRPGRRAWIAIGAVALLLLVGGAIAAGVLPDSSREAAVEKPAAVEKARLEPKRAGAESLLEQAREALSGDRLDLAERLIQRLESRRATLDEKLRKALDELRTLLDVRKLQQPRPRQSAGLPSELTRLWLESAGKLTPVAPQSKLAVDLQRIEGWKTAAGSWRAGAQGLSGQGAVLLQRGPLPSPAIDGAWRLPAGGRLPRSFGLLLSHVPPRGPRAHLALGVQTARGVLFIHKLVGPGPEDHVTLAAARLPRPPAAGERLTLALRFAQGALRLEAAIGGRSAVVERRPRFEDRLPPGVSFHLGVFSAGNDVTLERLSIETGRPRFRRPR